MEPLPVIHVDNNDTGLKVLASPSGIAPAPTLEPQVAAPDATHDPVTGPVDVDVNTPVTLPAPGLDVWQSYMGPTTASPPPLTYTYPATAGTHGGHSAASPAGTYGSATASSSPYPSLPPGNGFVSNSASAIGGYGAAAGAQPGGYGSSGISAISLPGGYGYGSAAIATTGSYTDTSPSPDTLARGLRRLLQAAAALEGQDTTSNPIIEVPTSPAVTDNDEDDTMAATSSGSVGGYGAYASQAAAMTYGAYGSVNGWGYGEISSAMGYGGKHMPGVYTTAAAAVVGNQGRHLMQAAGADLGMDTASMTAPTGSTAVQGPNAVGGYGTADVSMPSGYGYGSQAASVPGSYGQAAAMAYGGALPGNYGSSMPVAGVPTQGRRRLLQGGQEPDIEISQGTLTETGAVDGTADTGSDYPSSYTNYGLGGGAGVYTSGGYGDYGYAAGAYGGSARGPLGGYGYGIPSASTQSGRRRLLQVAAAQASISGEPLIEIPSGAATDDTAGGMPGTGASSSWAYGSYGAADTAMGYGGYGASAAAKPGGYGGPSSAAAVAPGGYDYGAAGAAAPTVVTTGGARRARRRLLRHIGL